MHPIGRLAYASHVLPFVALAAPWPKWPAFAAWGVAQAGVMAALLRPSARALAPNLTRLPEDCGGVALTYDDGPCEATPPLLDALAAAGVRAAFFVVGDRARARRDLVKRIAGAGHVVGNHSLTHPKAWSVIPRRRIEREIGEAQAILADITGEAPRWFRPPMGHKNFHLGEALDRHGLRQVTWSLRSYDTVLRDAGRVVRRVTRRLRRGDIVLMHDGIAAPGGGDPVAVTALRPILAALAERGLGAVSLPALPSSPAASTAAPLAPATAAPDRGIGGPPR